MQSGVVTNHCAPLTGRMIDKTHVRSRSRSNASHNAVGCGVQQQQQTHNIFVPTNHPCQQAAVAVADCGLICRACCRQNLQTPTLLPALITHSTPRHVNRPCVVMMLLPHKANVLQWSTPPIKYGMQPALPPSTASCGLLWAPMAGAASAAAATYSLQMHPRFKSAECVHSPG